MVQPNDTDRLLKELADRFKSDFLASQRILSFAEYLDLVRQNPRRHARSTAQYLIDAFDHFGTTQVRTPVGEMRRFNLFDGLDGAAEYLVGQEEAQNTFYRLLVNFARQGRINRLIILHGPNGSAKSSFVGCIARALEVYSHTEEGQLYRFNWVFPTEKVSRGAIGFGDSPVRRTSSFPTYAYLDDLEINARLTDPMRDHPLFLLSLRDREALLKRFLEEATPKNDGDFHLSDYLRTGELNDKNKRIVEALLASYHGDFGEVLKHVQVERFYLSRRYREGLASVGPQLRVDAGLRQLTSDKSLAALPPSLQSITLFEPVGDLVDGNRGMVEFEDILKRPMDLNRYLLVTGESGKVSMEYCTLFLDALLVGTVNEIYLDAMKTTPDWAAFKGRLELVRLPYLLDCTAEQRIYDVQVQRMEIAKPIAPHVTELAALWAVLTRLKRPKTEDCPEVIRSVIKRMTPRQKVDLYASGKLPPNITSEEARELKAAIPDLFREGSLSSEYEGRYGASPREIRTVLLHAGHSETHPCFSPLALVAELEKLVEDPSIYEFLRQEPDGEYQRPAEFIKVVSEEYLDLVDFEIRSAMGLIAEAQYSSLFERYVTHVSLFIRKEQIENPTTGRWDPPSEQLMADVEKLLGPGEVGQSESAYRNHIISSIGAFRIENPDTPVDLSVIFSRQFELLKRRFLEERKDVVEKIETGLLRYLDGETAELVPSDREQVEQTFRALKDRFGYDRETAREAIGFLARHRHGRNPR